jgi:hypothetical protein
MKAVGKNTLDLFKAFGSNKKKKNLAKLAADISKAQSKISKGFTKAEYNGKGDPKGCATSNDVGVLEGKVEAHVADIVADLCPTPGPVCGNLEFTTSTGVGNCGDITDTSGGGGTSLTPYGEGSPGLVCGSLYIGGGVSVQPPSAVPANATSVFKITDCSTATAYVLAPTTAGETGSSRTCTSPGCTFGPPLPIPNPGVPAISTCVINSIAASPAAGGVLNSTTGASTQTLPLSVLVHVTGDLEGGAGIQPCPTCTGTCNSGPSAGSACTSTWSGGTTHDCPPPSGTSLPSFGVDLSPLTTGTSALDHASGGLCTGTTGQRTNGCFGNGTCEHIEQTGSAGGAISQGGGSVATTLGSVFCIPSSGNMLIDTVADLPGPGSTSLPGAAEIP